MSSLFDNPLIQLLYGGTQTIKDYNQNKRVGGLLGEAPAEFAVPRTVGSQAGLFDMDPMGNSIQGQQPTVSHPGSGLLGNQMTVPQFGAELMRYGATTPAGTSILTNEQTNQAAMQRQMQEQQINMQQRGRYGGSENINQRGQAIHREAKAYEQQEAPYRAGVESVGLANQVLLERKGIINFSAQDDIALVNLFRKTLLPAEAVMGEEYRTVVAARGGEDWLRGLYGKIASGQELTVKQRGDIYGLMNDLGKVMNERYQTRRDTAERRAKANYLDKDVYMQIRLKYERPAAQFMAYDGQQPAGGAGGMPADVVPYNPAPSPKNPSSRWGW